MSKKIIGWLLLAIGLVLISYILYSSFNIFTGNKEAPSLFKASQEVKVTNNSETTSPNEVAQFEMEKIIKEQLQSILPSNLITKFLNLISWTFLAGIFIFGGSKISLLGISLLEQ